MKLYNDNDVIMIYMNRINKIITLLWQRNMMYLRALRDCGLNDNYIKGSNNKIRVGNNNEANSYYYYH